MRGAEGRERRGDRMYKNELNRAVKNRAARSQGKEERDVEVALPSSF